MKRIFAYSIIALLSLCAACTSSETGDKAPKVVFELDNDKISISPDGGEFSVTFRTNSSWVLKTQEGGEWCVPSITEGEANMEEGVTVYFSADMTYDSREAIFWFEISGMSRQLLVSQKAKPVIEPDENNHSDVGAEGAIISINFNATYPCAVVIPDDAKGWVEQIASRAMESYTLQLNVLENTTYSARETVVKVVMIDNEDVYEEYSISQAQKNAILSGDDTMLTIGSKGGNVRLDFMANIEWDVEISAEGQEWISCGETLDTRALTASWVEVTVAENLEYESRSATVKIVSLEDSSIYALYTITQAQCDAILADENNTFTVPAEGSEIIVNFDTNVLHFDVVIPEDVDWITFVDVEPASRALESMSAKLWVSPNVGYDEREAVVRVVMVDNGEVYAEYIIRQEQYDAVLADGSILFEVPSTGGEVDIDYLTNVECAVVIAEEDAAWISVKEETRALNAESKTLIIAPNDTHDARSAVVKVVKVDGEELFVAYTITQAQMDDIILDGNKIEATVDGGVVDLGYRANVDCEVIIPEGCEWITIAPDTRGLEEHNLSLIISANDTFEPREAVVSIHGAGIERDITVLQEGKRFNVATTEYLLELEASTLEIEVDTNVAYDVEIASDCDWIALAEGMENPAKGSLLLNILENETIYARSAEVTLKHGEKVVVVSITQKGDEGLLSVDEEFVVEGKSVEVTVELKSNFKYEVILPEDCDWVSMPETRAAVQSSTVRFMVDYNNSVQTRSVDILFADSKNTISKSIRITQLGNHLLEIFEVKDDEILYITTDGNKLVPKNSSFGSFMLDNVYENGYGRITFTGPVTQLGDKVFKDCSNIKQIAIPGCVVSIGNDAFKGCNKMDDILIPQSVKTLGAGAFSGSSIATVTFEEGSQLESIGKDAFSNCINIKDVVIPDGVVTIGNSAFRNCVNIKSMKLSAMLENIGNNAFGSCQNITSITISEGVKVISECAFLNCSKLQEVVLASGVEEIDLSAFSGCISLKNVVFPDNVQIIDSNAFYNCHSISELSFGEASQLKSIGKNAFMGCTAVERVILPSSLETIGVSAFSGCAGELFVNASIADNTSTAVPFAGSAFESVTINEGVKSIGSYAFYGCNTIQSLVLNDGVESLGENAFAGCSSIKEFDLPVSVKSVGDMAFNGCTSVLSLNIPSSVESIGASAFVGCAGELRFNVNIADGASATKGLFCGSKFDKVVVGDDVTYVGKYAFEGCNTIAEVLFGGSVESLGEAAFRGCSSLKEVLMPASLTTIGNSLFANCELLSSVSLSEGITAISESAFSGCTSLLEINIPDAVTTICDKAFSGAAVMDVAFGEASQMQSVGKEAFMGCVNLNNFVIPATVTTLGDSAFSGCKAMESITLPASVTTMGKSLFESCSALASVVLSENLTTISESAFADCTNLSLIAIPDGVTTIDNKAFEMCSSLPALNFGEASALAVVGNEAFSLCTALVEAKLPTTVTTIGDSAFSGCSALAEIRFDETSQLQAIGKSAFNGCTAVNSVVLPAGVQTIGTSAFVGCGGSLTLNANIANGATAAEGIFNGSKFVNVAIGQGVTSVGDYAFAGCDTLKSVAVGDNVVTLGNGIFQNCAAMTDITFGETSELATIGKEAFKGCASLKGIALPDAVTTIPDSAFKGCSSLSDITFGAESQIAIIGKEAFAECVKIRFVNIPDSVTKLGESAFTGCTSLVSAIMGSGMTDIEAKVYSGCSALNIVYSNAVVPPTMGEEVFAGCPKSLVIYVPMDSVEDYKRAKEWSNYANAIVGAEL